MVFILPFTQIHDPFAPEVDASERRRVKLADQLKNIESANEECVKSRETAEAACAKLAKELKEAMLAEQAGVLLLLHMRRGRC